MTYVKVLIMFMIPVQSFFMEGTTNSLIRHAIKSLI